MATFAPNVPEQYSPDFLNYARPTQAPITNISGETIGRAKGETFAKLGQGIEQGANLGNTVQEEMISSGMHKEHDQVSSDQIARLGSLYNSITGSASPSVLTGDKQSNNNIPPDLANKYPGIVNDLIALKANGQVSNLYFDARRDQIAKEYRSAYPGQRDFIDQENFRMTRSDPANRVISDLTSNINSYMQLAREGQNKEETKLTNAVFQGLITPAQKDEALRTGNMTKAENIIYSQAKAKRDLEMGELSLRYQNMKDENVAKKAQGIYGSAVASDIQNDLDNVHVPINGQQIGTNDLVTGLQSGKYQSDTQTKQEISSYLATQQQQSYARQWARMHAIGQDGQSWVGRMFQGNETRAKEWLDAQYATTWGHYRDLWDNKETGLVGSVKRAVDAKLDDYKGEIYGDDAIGFSIALTNQLKELSTANPALGQALTNSVIKNTGNLQKHVIPMYERHVGQMVTQTTPTPSATNFPALQVQNRVGNPYTLDQSIKDTFAMFDKNPGDPTTTAVPMINSFITTIPHILAASNIPVSPVKNNVAQAAFSDRDFPSLGRIKRDAIDTQGLPVKGQDWAIAQLTSPKMSQEMVNRIGKEHPERLQEYESFLKTQYSNLMTSDFRELNQMSAIPGVNIGWDSEKHKFFYQLDPKIQARQMAGVGFQGGRSTTGPAMVTSPDMARLQNALYRINMGADSLYAWGKASGEDMNGFFAQLFLNSGLDPKIANRATIGGQMVEAHKSANRKPTEQAKQ